MDEHLCWGKRADDKEWMFGYFMQEPSGRTLISAYSTLAERWDWAEVDPSTTGRCTGLTDKNGMKIFGGDIIRFAEWAGGDTCWIGSVADYGSMFVVRGPSNEECETGFEIQLSRIDKKRIDIIGNIHDNPELLEEES